MAIEFSKDTEIAALRQQMYAALAEAEKASYAYWTACEVGAERSWGAELYEVVRNAPRTASQNL
jgi:hypothetical protein